MFHTLVCVYTLAIVYREGASGLPSEAYMVWEDESGHMSGGTLGALQEDFIDNQVERWFGMEEK